MFDRLIRMIDERKHEQLQLDTLSEMAQCPLHKLLSLLHIPAYIFSFRGIKNVVMRKKRRRTLRRRRRTISSSSDEESTMKLLYVTVSPLFPTVTDIVNTDW